jgi:HSP20 family molecular chaperone IbpA
MLPRGVRVLSALVTRSKSTASNGGAGNIIPRKRGGAPPPPAALFEDLLSSSPSPFALLPEMAARGLASPFALLPEMAARGLASPFALLPEMAARGLERGLHRVHLPSSIPFDLVETATAYELHAELPGVAKDDVRVEVDEDERTITISATKEFERPTSRRSGAKHRAAKGVMKEGEKGAAEAQPSSEAGPQTQPQPQPQSPPSRTVRKETSFGTISLAGEGRVRGLRGQHRALDAGLPLAEGGRGGGGEARVGGVDRV